MIVEFDTSSSGEVHPEVLKWVRDNLTPLKSRRVLWPAKSMALRDVYGTMPEDFEAVLAEYQVLVPVDADLPITEILEEVGLTWVMYRVKYIGQVFLADDKSYYQTMEKLVVILDDADSIMLKMAFLGRAGFKMKVH